MKHTMRLALLAWTLLLVIGPASLAYSQPPGGSDGVLVGRITHISGKLLRYVPEEKDWVVTVKDAPFGLNDALYSDRSGKAEFIMPNATMIRVGSDTQIQLIAVRTDVTEMDVASGMARFYNRSGEAVIKTTTPFGYIVAGSGTVFDVYVGDESLEVIALKGTVEFILESDQTRYEVKAGSSSLLSDGKRVGAGEGNVDADWDDWNIERDSLWSKRAQVKGDSYKYVPPALYDDAYELEEHGRWDRVQYEGNYYNAWRPAGIRPGWRPYTVGRWSDYYGDNCWIPYYEEEPWGYVTHHYGSWMYVNDYWYWAPPVVSVGVSVGPAVGLGFGWYPGRVGWVGAGVNIGWFPLAPWETYYSHRHWGPGAVVVNNISINTLNINNYRYADYGVAVPHSAFYRVNNYYDNRFINIDRRTIINNNYVTAPVVNDRIFTNFSNSRERFTYTNAVAEMRPHSVALDRIQRNMTLGTQARGLNASAIERDVSRFRTGSLGAVGATQLTRPSLSSRLVSPADAGRPRSDVQFQQRALGSRVRAVEESPVNRMNVLDQRRTAGRGGVETGSPGQMLQPGGAVGQGRRLGVGESTGQPGTIQAPLDAGRRRKVGVSDQGETGTLQPGDVERRGRRIGAGESTGQPGTIQAPLDAGRRRKVGVSDQGETGTLQPGDVERRGRRIGAGESTGQPGTIQAPLDAGRRRKVGVSDQGETGTLQPGDVGRRGRRIGAGESTGQPGTIQAPPDSGRMRRMDPNQDSGAHTISPGDVGRRGRRIGAGESTGQPGTIQAPPDSGRMRRMDPNQDSGAHTISPGNMGNRGRRIGAGESTGQPGTIQAPPDSGRMRRMDPNQDSGAHTISPGNMGNRGRRIGAGESMGQPGTIQAPPDSGRMRRMDPNQDSGAHTISPGNMGNRGRRIGAGESTGQPGTIQAPPDSGRMRRMDPNQGSGAHTISPGNMGSRGRRIGGGEPSIGTVPQGNQGSGGAVPRGQMMERRVNPPGQAAPQGAPAQMRGGGGKGKAKVPGEEQDQPVRIR